MPLTAPEWLTRRGGELRPLPDGRSWTVMFNNARQYRLTAPPVAGTYGCEVMQSINGRRADQGRTFPSAEEAIAGGLEDLRKALGW